jgi:menaquinone-dependent protoporphyrinogen oxidase
MSRVLLVYATKYGSVGEVSRFVGAVLRDEGAETTIAEVGESPDPAGFDLVVLGTGLYMGRLHRGARRFLREHHAELSEVPFAVFAMGPLSSAVDEREKVRPQLEKGLARYPEIRPIVAEIFGGVIDPAKLSFPFSHMPAGDHRDWDEIRRFALALPIAAPVAA